MPNLRLLHVAIDASNIRQGGGLTHLSQMLAAAVPTNFGIGRVTVLASNATASQLPIRHWLETISPNWIDLSSPIRLLVQQLVFDKELTKLGCDVLFVPGGSIPIICNIPVVTMSQNLLPFEPQEAILFGRWSPMRFKMWLLRQIHIRSFCRADGIIFLTQYAKNTVTKWIGSHVYESALIPHGVEKRFMSMPKPQKSACEFTLEQPFELLYVSILMPYKHQLEVAQAVSDLRQAGCIIKMRFIGLGWGDYGKNFRAKLFELDPFGKYLTWDGEMPFSLLHQAYIDADAFVFASSCENLPNILIEAMASGLPIACSERGPMPEVLGDAGIYFNPDKTSSITNALLKLIDNAELRQQIAQNAWDKSRNFSWERCANDTFKFIEKIASQRIKSKSSVY